MIIIRRVYDNEKECTLVYVCMRICVRICVWIYIYVCVFVCVYVCVHIHVCVCDIHAVVDWPAMEKLWYHTLHYVLRVTPEEHPVLMSEPPVHDLAKKEEMTEIMFESFNVPKFYVQSQPVLSVFSSGRTSGECVPTEACE